jgi:portal protein
VGLWSFLRKATELTEAVPSKELERKDFSSGGWDGRQPEIWDNAHLLNQIIAPMTSDREQIENGFEAYVEGAYKRNGVVWAVIMARQTAFSMAAFKWRRYDKETGRPGEMYRNGKLSLIERPWPGGTTGELLSRMEQDASLAGNSWWTHTDDQGRYGKAAVSAKDPSLRLARLRPDWVTMVIGQKGKSPSASDPFAIDATVLSIIYKPVNGMSLFGGHASDESTVVLMPDEVMHYSPYPDPIARFRGMSWLTPILREIEADTAATKHKKAFYDNAAVPNLAVKFDRDTSRDAFVEFVEAFKANHGGNWNAYKTLFLMGGADVTPLSHDFQQLDFTKTQGRGEARIAMAGGVPSQWLGTSEGMQSSALAGSSLPAARRRFADGTIRYLWEVAAVSLEDLLDTPVDAHLWYDDRDVAFLREDEKDRADILAMDASSINVFIMAGFKPDAAVKAVRDQDVGHLIGEHTGLISVQMQAMQDAGERDARLDAPPVATLVTAGFTYESAVLALAENDISLLVKDPKRAEALTEGMGAPQFGGPGGGGTGPRGAGQSGKPSQDKPTKPDKSHDPRTGEENGQ